jgi:predicted phage terminase large subunit-like protein
VVFIGTIHHYNSLLAQFTGSNKNPGWQKRIYRSVVSWSEHPELWETWVRIFNNKEDYINGTGSDSARLFYEANKEAMLQGTKVLWPATRSYYNLMVMREQEGYYSFDSEMQNEPVDPKNCHFNPEERHLWDDQFKSEEELIAFVGANAVFYGACDPSMGKQNRHGDFSAIVTALLDSNSGKIYIVDADIARRKPDKTIADILAYQARRKYRAFGFETNQFQEYMADELQKESEKRGYYLPLEKINHASDKKARIESLQPLVKNGTILFSRKHYTLLEQMKFFPKGSHDDGLDALEMAVNLCKNHSGGSYFIVPDYDAIGRQSRYGEDHQNFVFKITIPEPNKHRPAFG